MNIHAIVKAVRSTVIKHGPEILTAMGTVGLIVSGIMAVNETPKAIDILRQHEEEAGLLTTKEKVQDCWKLYLPSTLLAVSSVASIIFARRIDSKRMAAWAAAYQMSESALTRLEKSIKEEYGERKLEKMKDKSDIQLLEENPINPEEIINTGDGDDLFLDYYSGRYFRSTPDAIKARYNNWVSSLLRNDYQSVNSWVTAIDIPPIGEELGDEMGFTATMYHSRDLGDEPIFTYGPGYLDKPCAVVKLSCRPSTDYTYNY